MSGISPKKEIILKPNNVLVKEKGNQLVVTYKARNLGMIIVFGLLFAGTAAYTISQLMIYINIGTDRKAAYEEKRTEEVNKIQEQHRIDDAKFRKDIEWEGGNIDMKISSQELSLRTAEMIESLDGSSPPFGEERSPADIKAELEQLKQRKQRLIFMMDSIQQAGPIRDLTPSELEEQLVDFNRVHNHRLEANTDDLISHVVIPNGVLLLVLLVCIWVFRTFFGDDILIIDKQEQSIHKKRSTRFGKSKKIFIHKVKQFYCEKKVSGGDYTHTYHSLMYIDDNDQTHVLLQQVREANDAIYIEHKIEEFLGIENIHVRGGLN